MLIEPEVQQKVIMFHTGRCGSTVLGNMLNQNPRINWASEIFESCKNQYNQITDRNIKHHKITAIIQEHLKHEETRIFGFESKYLPEQQLRSDYINMSLTEFLQYIKDLGFSYFIVLHRRNYLRRAVSALVALMTKQYQSYVPVNYPTTVNLNPNRFLNGNIEASLLEHFHSMDDWYSTLTGMLSNDNCLFLNYEDHILSDPLIAYEKVCEFLSVEPGDVSINNHQTNPFSMNTIVENFSDVIAHFAGTDYEWMLND